MLRGIGAQSEHFVALRSSPQSLMQALWQGYAQGHGKALVPLHPTGQCRPRHQQTPRQIRQHRTCRESSQDSQARQLSWVTHVGFDLSGGTTLDVDRQASGLVKAASSLLLLQPALQGSVAQSFLVLLTHIAQRKRPGLVEAYG